MKGQIEIRVNLGLDTFAFRMQNYGGVSNVFEQTIRHFQNTDVSFLEAVPPNWAKRLNLDLDLHENRIRFSVKRILEKSARMIIPRQKVDLIHLTYYDNTILQYYPKIPVVTNAYDFIPERFPEYFPNGNPHLNKLEVISNSDLVFSISQTTTRDLHRFIPQLNARVVNIPLGTNINDFNSSNLGDILTSLNLVNSRYILYVGRRDTYKNVDLLIKAWTKNSNHDLVLFGGGDLIESELKLVPLYKKSRIHTIEGDNHVLATLYRNAEFLVFPSIWEGFGLPILEALQTGCAVICSQLEVFEELFDDAVTYFDPNSEEDLLEKFDLIANRNYRDSIVKKGLHLSSKYNWRETARIIEEEYQKLLTKR